MLMTYWSEFNSEFGTSTWAQRLKWDKANVLIFEGGEDIGTELYDERPVYQGGHRRASPRDITNKLLWEQAVAAGKLCVGICRGAQILNVLAGGKLWQDVNGHVMNHPLVTSDGQRFMRVPSTHHQMMRPGHGAELIAYAEGVSTRRQSEWVAEFTPQRDPEIVWYPEFKTLCIQSHPEYVPTSDFGNYCWDLIERKAV